MTLILWAETDNETVIRDGEKLVAAGFERSAVGTGSYRRDASKPIHASPAAMMQAIQLAHTGTETVPLTIICHPPIARMNCSTAMMANNNAASRA